MRRAHLLATLSSAAALLVGVSCDSDGGGVGAGGAGGTAGRVNDGAGSGGAASGGASSGGAAAGTSNGNGGASASGGASANGGASASGGASANGGASGSSGEGGSGGVEVGGAAGASEGDAGVTSVGDGEPCPNGDECGAGLVCVGYGNPLPNGESSACRRRCTAEAPPPHCTCQGGGFCEESAGDPDAGSDTIGCGDTDAGCTCGEVIVNAGCADADDATTDFQSGEFLGCLHWRDLGEGQGWIQYDTSGGFHYDLQTSLGWVIRTSPTMTLAETADFCASFEIAGLSEWRLPTIDEARSLAGGCADTAPGGSCPISDPTCLEASCGSGDDCTSCSGSSGNYYCRPDAKICVSMHTSSLCSDCLTPGGWRYGTINGNFFSGSVDSLLFPVCVMENIPRAVPCRN